MRRTVMVRGPVGTPVSVYSPFGPVIAPIRVPDTVTWTSGRPRPSAASVTRPLIVPVGACAASRIGEAIASTRISAPRRTKSGFIVYLRIAFVHRADGAAVSRRQRYKCARPLARLAFRGDE